MSNLLLIEHMEFANEQFHITDARFNHYQNAHGYWELLLAFTQTRPLQLCPLLAQKIQAQPTFLLALVSPVPELLEKHHLIYQRQSQCPVSAENLAYFHYFLSKTIAQLKVHILDADISWLKLNLHGMTIINGSNGHTFDARLTLRDVTFQHDTKLTRAVN